MQTLLLNAVGFQQISRSLYEFLLLETQCSNKYFINYDLNVEYSIARKEGHKFALEQTFRLLSHSAWIGKLRTKIIDFNPQISKN
jgi:hypothetical protein